ncbi:Cupredoxin [Ramicandelaber brevisporus]|nr:Cupredoxin [Ramicandelaber brevisporus]
MKVTSFAATAACALLACVASATEIEVGNHYFKPSSITVPAGTKVTFKFVGGYHDVVEGTNCSPSKRSGMFRSDKLFAGGKYEYTFTEKGTFDYFCTPHCRNEKMVGSITVN